MRKLQWVIRHICKIYPHSNELSNARLTKLVFLADWRSAQKYGQQISEIKWFFNNFGPFVYDVLNEAEKDPKLQVIKTTTIYGTPKTLIKLIDQSICTHGYLQKEEITTIDSVIEETKNKFWNSFIKHIYNTYPVKINPRYSYLNLVDLALLEKESMCP